MKQRVMLVLMTLFALLSLGGCKVASTGLSDSEMDQVAEYTAKLLLKHVRGYKPTLLENIEVKDDPSLVKEKFDVIGKKEKPDETVSSEDSKQEEMKPSEEKEDEKKAEKDGDGTEAGEPAEAKQLGDIYGVKGAEVIYGGSGEYKKYPNDEGYFSLVPPSGMKLFTTTFFIKNTTKSKLQFKHDQDVKYSLVFGSGKTYKPSITLLERDMKFLDVSIEPGKRFEGVIVFNLPEGMSIKDAKLLISGKGLQYELSVSQ